MLSPSAPQLLPDSSLPQVFHAAGGATFAASVVAYITQHYAPQEWPQIHVFLPNRRSVTTLRDAFFDTLEAKTALLPVMIPLADIDPQRLLLMQGIRSDVPPIPLMHPARRLMLLARQVEAFMRAHGENCTVRVALEMAESLAQLLDEAVRYGADLRRIRHLVPEGFSAHWQHSAEFLAIVGEHWPRIVASLGMCSLQQAQSDALSRLALAWEEHPPAFPIISAGSTGSQPLTLRLLHSIANAPRGVVILPTLGRDIDMQEDAAITQTHPLAHVAASAQFLGYRLSDLPMLTRTTSTANAQWMAQIFSIASSGVTSVPMPESLIPICCRDEWEEARVIGLILREGLQSSTVRMMVVSPDRSTLARVATLLTRWNITADVATLKRLNDHPLVSWWHLLLALVSSHAGAIESLAFLQHAVSFAHNHTLRDACARAVDEHYARGLAKTRSMDGLTYALRQASVPSEHSDTMETAIRALEQLFACEKSQAPIAEWLATLLLCAESWGAGTNIDEMVLSVIAPWRGDMLSEPLSAEAVSLLIEQVCDVPWRDPAAGVASHPQIILTTPMEARLQPAYCVILAGLNENVWPRLPASSWLNQSMRQCLGLPTQEHELSLQSHDFMMLASYPLVYLIRSERSQQKVMNASRWWQRVELMGMPEQSEFHCREEKRLLQIARRMDQAEEYRPALPPTPNPPLSARPLALRMTQMQDLMQNPYAVYARSILKLEEPEAIDGEPDARLFGTLLHAVVERAVKLGGSLSDDQQKRLVEQALSAYPNSGKIRLFWYERLLRGLAFFCAEHQRNLDDYLQVQTEFPVTFTLPLTEDSAMEFRGRVDRVETRRDGHMEVVDIKTSDQGLSGNKLANGELPQLWLYHMGLVQAQHGQGFIPHLGNVALSYWIMPNGQDEGEIKASEIFTAEQVTQVLERFTKHATYYACSQSPLLYAPAQRAERANYSALARAAEWGGME